MENRFSNKNKKMGAAGPTVRADRPPKPTGRPPFFNFYWKIDFRFFYFFYLIIILMKNTGNFIFYIIP